MGLISEGRPLTWQEIAEVRSQLKSHALNDLIRILREHRHRHSDPFLWGDEVNNNNKNALSSSSLLSPSI